MSQMGMSMPGSQRGRRATMNVYTGLMLGAVLCLLAAVIVVAMQGALIGPGGGIMSAFKIHDPKSTKLDLGK